MPREPRITRQTSGKLAPTQRFQAATTGAPCIGEELAVRWKGYDYKGPFGGMSSTMSVPVASQLYICTPVSKSVSRSNLKVVTPSRGLVRRSSSRGRHGSGPRNRDSSLGLGSLTGPGNHPKPLNFKLNFELAKTNFPVYLDHLP